MGKRSNKSGKSAKRSTMGGGNVQPVRKTSNRRRRGAKKSAPMGNVVSTLSAAGRSFLKCATSPADFVSGSFMGIPDESDAAVVTREFKLAGGLQAYTSGYDVYYVLLPMPGYAYFWGQRAAGSLGAITLNGVPYAGVNTLFPTNAESTNVTSARIASNVIELVPTVNEMTWGGSIQTFKGKVSMNSTYDGTALGSYAVTLNYIDGLEILNSSEPNEVYPFNKGVYMPTFNTEPSYPYSPIQNATTWAEMTANASVAPAPTVTYASVTNYNFFCLTTLECAVIKLPALPANQTAIIRTWQAAEFLVNPSSIIWDYRHISPHYDPKAMAILKAFADSHPGSVDYAKNPDFWENLVSWAGHFLKAAKFAVTVGEAIMPLL